MLNTIIGMMGTIVVIGLFGCLWKFLGIKLQKMKKQIELTKYKKICRIILLASLLVNYLFYFKIANDGQKFTFTDKNHLMAFIFMCIGIILIIGFLGFIICNTTKRIFLDKKENLFKVSTIGFFW